MLVCGEYAALDRSWCKCSVLWRFFSAVKVLLDAPAKFHFCNYSRIDDNAPSLVKSLVIGPLNVISLKVKSTGEPLEDVMGIDLSEQFWAHSLRQKP